MGVKQESKLRSFNSSGEREFKGTHAEGDVEKGEC